MFRAKPAAEPTVIGRGTTIEGNLRATGRVQVDGRLEGKLEVDGQVSVGPNGSIAGELIADELAIGGRVEGKVTARKHLFVAATGAVIGELCYGTLQVERGAVLDGRALRGDGDAHSQDVTDDEHVRLSPTSLAARAAG
jgi:cytoskeletal protein CcmA (bactofilin family)